MIFLGLSHPTFKYFYSVNVSLYGLVKIRVGKKYIVCIQKVSLTNYTEGKVK